MERTGSAELSGVVEEGLGLARAGRYREALRIFDTDICFTQHPLATSYYALCLAVVEKEFDKAVSLCIIAAEKEFYNPEIYFNLGRVFLLNGQKAIAIKAFRKGLAFDNAHLALLNEIKRLGIRRSPVVSFLPRTSSINRFLGMLMQRRARAHAR